MGFAIKAVEVGVGYYVVDSYEEAISKSKISLGCSSELSGMC